jgi:acyl transferase domain-containing protein/enoyl-CoA hydratase/carnithine racemase/NAD(P)-dependent dehydrogenase (short-subunit alcohol dehydrogenase family)/acyl carrier protein
MKELLRHIYDDLVNGRLSQREALEKVKALKREQQRRSGTLFMRPVWQVSPLGDGARAAYERRHIIVVDLPSVDFAQLPDSECTAIFTDPRKNLAERYTDAALQAFQVVQDVLQRQRRGHVLVQIVVADALFAGLSGLLRTASLENPRVAGQLILVDPDLSTEKASRLLHDEHAPDAVVRYQNGERQVLRWDELPDTAEEAPVAFQDGGVYLITGGAGRLGGLFAREIVERTAARVVLAGRSPLTGATLDDRVSYRQADIADLEQVTELIASIRYDYGRLDGILQCAGIIADNFILKKNGNEFARVLAPKVAGTFNLDQASRDINLDFFMLFSSVSGAAGTIGQADYATGNAFMDRFSAWRNEQVAAGRRHGRTRSINWSGWDVDGMDTDEANRERLRQATGMQPMPTATGIRAFHRCLALPWDQVGVSEGDFARMRVALFSGRLIEQELAPLAAPPVSSASIERSTFVEKAREFLRNECAHVLGLQPRKIDPQAPLENYGIDSILAVRLTTHLERTFGPLAKTLFFEYGTIAELTGYFLESHLLRLEAVLAAGSNQETQTADTPRVERRILERRSSRRADTVRAAVPAPAQSRDADPIAIIGLSGRYPEAVDIDAYWRNLRDGKDCITEVPKERWDWQQYFSDDRTKSGHHYSKWGGFITGVDEFDPLFFNISPKDAKGIDPQERLFLQHAWAALEDAGYTRAALQIADADDLPGQVGVYAGVMYTEYQLFGADAAAQGRRIGVAGSMASIANRVSYSLNLHGPSVTFDTMCSSSVTAIHFACLDLKQGRTSLAIAGGVNVTVHPNKYLVLSSGQFISSDGHCQSFGEGGDGYIPGEGVGVVILKRLSDAQRDGDHIYGIIRGSSLNHGGKTNGYTVPNPQAQASVIRRALLESGIDARHVSYIEAHGTGTKLGDPIEIAALSKAFAKSTRDTGFCLVGSVKSNIGHCESAAGIAGLTKVLLQMQHRQIVPSLHSAQLNPNIDFERTPFVVNQSLRSWDQPVIDGRPVPRIAGISSFGAGGSNAHILIEEYRADAVPPMALAAVAIVLSARTAEQLRQKAQDLLDFVRPRESTIDLAAVAYTLQTGREAMDERLGFIVKSAGELIARLEAYVAGERGDSYQGQVRRDREALSLFSTDAGLQQTVETWIAGHELTKLLEFWVKGLELDWAKLYGRTKPPRISLPVYPFAKERYWLDIEAAPVVGAATAVLHPLLHRNTSDLTQQSYSSHIEAPLSASAYLEMARAAVQDAARVSRETVVELRDVRWAHPLPAAEELHVALLPDLSYEIYSHGTDEEIIHCQGRAAIVRDAAEIRTLGGELLRRVRLPESAPDYVLHPAVLDDALRAAGDGRAPAAVDSLCIMSPCTADMTVWVRRSAGDRLELDLCDERGNVCVQVRGVVFDAPSAAVAGPIADQPVVARTRREITLLPVERKTRGAIALSAPGAVDAAERAPGKTRLTLSNTVVGEPAVVSSVRLYDDGNGVFSIEINAGGDVVALLRQVLGLVQAEPSAKVLLLRGLESASVDYDQAVERKLFEAIVSFPYPTIALLNADTGGAAFMAAALCDFLVCNEDATYASPVPSIPALTLFSERFGELLAQDFLYRATCATGGELRAKGWTCAILPADELEPHARTLASALTAKSQEALRLLKQHLTRALVDRVAALTPVESPEPAAAAACEVIILSGDIAEDALPQLQQRILDSDVPVVAALTGNAKGNAWLVAQYCDACVYSRQGLYSVAGVGEAAAGAFAYRLGNEAAREILLTGADYSGSELEQRVAGLIAVDADRVVATAEEVAASWARLPRTALAEWKRHSIAVLQEQISSAVSPGQPEATAESIEMQSSVVTVTAQPNGVVVVKMEEREARNMFSGDLIAGLNEAFAHIAATPSCKVVVLTGYDTYFAAGGTKESLLDIQAGKLRFTDQKIFQLPLDCRLPVIAAMQGHGLGAGWALGMFADVALLSEESRYVSPYMNYGFTPGAGATLILPDKIGKDLARESLLTAQAQTGRELKARGLRLPVLPRADVLPAAMALAGQIAQASRERLIALKQQLTAYIHQPLEETYQRELAMHDRTFVQRAETAEKIHLGFHSDTEVPAAPAVPAGTIDRTAAAGGSDALRSVTASLRTLLANELQMSESDVIDDAQFVDLGLDSIGGVSLLRKVNEKYRTSIEATKIYSYPTLAQLARYIKEQAEQNGAFAVPPTLPHAIGPNPIARKLTSWRSRPGPRLAAGPSASRPQAIAVVGMAGQFPQARNLDEFWQNLAEGKNCVRQVPADRWDLQKYFQPGATVPGKTNCPWVGALDEYDRFDPLFFNISPLEAENMDPQQRLFLQSCWHSIEHAGYDARALSGTRCGVFVGCAAGDYHDRSQPEQLSAHGFTGGATSILAARISYFLNLQGPCVAIDTACSSSLVAIAQACDSLNSGGSDVALAGGVYVMAGPSMHIMTAQAGMLSPEGKCFTFDQRADGFVPGEGVGVVMLKRLADAERDGDVIYGVLEGWAINQDGKTNGITAPNPESQTRLEQEVYDRYGIDPSHIQLVEAHGTGTKLGDPIEVEGLQNAFGKYTTRKQYCALGSVKSNIGHCLTAAGIAGVIKLLLALEHKQVPPTINFEQLNEHIDLADGPFYVNTRLQDWALHGAPRRLAAISSFGFSGTNAHLVIGEAPSRPAGRARPAASGPVIVPLSARTPDQLREKASDLLTFLRKSPSVELADLAYTLQTGRTPMDERLGFIVSSLDQLTERLAAWLEGATYVQDCQQGRVKHAIESTSDESPTRIKDVRLLELWIQGLDVQWNRLYTEHRPRRIALPVYPFAKERYWMEPAAATPASSALHPLLHANTSDFSQQSYSATFNGKEFFLADHQVRTDRGTVHKFLPGVAYLEMARAAIEHALAEPPEARVLELRNFVWVQPVVVTDKKEVRIALVTDDADGIEYEIYSRAGDDEVVHAQGRGILTAQPAPPALNVAQIEKAMTRGRLERAGAYETFHRAGLMYGPTFQTITSIRRGADQALASLRLPDGVDGEYVLHPSLLDGAIQACLGLLDDADTILEPRLPFALDALRVFAPCTRDMLAWVRSAAGSTTKLDIDLCDASGNVAVQLLGFTLRAIAQPQPVGRLYATPVWQVSEAAPGVAGYAEHHVVVCDRADAVQLEALLPDCHLTVLRAEQLNVAERYTAHAVACFERVEDILRRRPQGRVLFQIVVTDALFAGLSALLKTAALENPQFAGQVIIAAPDLPSAELAVLMQRENPLDGLIRYYAGHREVRQWQEVSQTEETSPVEIRDSGVYLITGGLGALGILFANEILARTSEARVVLAGRTSQTAEIALDERASYIQADVTDPEQVTQLIATVRREYGRLDGILHCAGTIADNFIVKKSGTEFRQVLAPKVMGTFHLDKASCDVELDFFVLFSSVASATGNLGQADYATGNAFMDGFAAARNRQVAAGARHGRTRSINWPLWIAGGMQLDPAKLELVQQTTGIQPMQTAAGIDAFYRCLGLPYDQVLVAEGDLARLRRVVLAGGVTAATTEPVRPLERVQVDSESLVARAGEFLRKELSGLLKLPSYKIDPQAPLETYGIDSILAMKLTSRLEQTFGSLSKTLFFEYQTIGELARYFVQSHAPRLATMFADAGAGRTEAVEVRPATLTERKLLPRRRFSSVRTAGPVSRTDREPIAIIGLSGRYPEAADLQTYWRNLREGKDCIVEVPKERWDWREYYSEDRTSDGRHYSKWGGFIAGVDEFDPLFFNISPKEAKYLDPQERLFLQHAWMAIEDAGYTRARLQTRSEGDLPGQAGVYAGVMYTEYQLFGTAGSAASIANRVSYALNLHGPSMTLDTMCSSSLTAIHTACQDLKQGRINLAIAGGVNVSIHPNKYLVLSAGQFISSDGHCQSFGEGGDGYIPGEGVGVVILKRLSDAERDGDHIYGVIRGSALNHGGKTNGYSVPNPQAQATAVRRALAESHTDPRHISYIEAHGTGTKLGDPIEIAALTKAFGQTTQDTGFCLIGSAKSNIGHCESAAGIAGLTKVLLQMQHRQIVPSLHSAQLNPNIDFEKTPFVVNQSLRSWEQPVIDGRPVPRIAGISSFGAGGSNAHIIIEEYRAPVVQPVPFTDATIVLSARTADQLRQKAQDLIAFIRESETPIDLTAVAYTLHVGREAMDERLGLVVTSTEELSAKLGAYVRGEQEIEGLYLGQVKKNREAISLFSTDDDLRQAVEKWVASRKSAKLLELWVKGLEVEWDGLYGDTKPQRISLPVYPFAKERYWMDVTKVAPVAAKPAAAAVLHPLLHNNTSDLSEQSYSSTFSGDEFFLKDYQGILPASAYLEMARAAIEHAWPAPPESPVLQLRDVVWAQQPVSPNQPIFIALLATGPAEIEYEIYSEDAGQEIVHCQGSAVRSSQTPHAVLDLAGLGLARLQLPASLQETAKDFVLHPSLMEGALQACVAVLDSQPRLPFALESLRILSPCKREMAAWVRHAAGSQAADDVVKVDIDLCDAQGNVCAELRGVSWRLTVSGVVEPLADRIIQSIAERTGEKAQQPVVLSPAVRREIRVVPEARPMAVEENKRGTISLAAPRPRVLAQPSTARASITISDARLGRASLSAVSPVTLFDEGNGIFSIHIAAGSQDVVAQLLRALEGVRQEASVKVLSISGVERAFPRGTRDEYNEAVQWKLYEAIVSFPVPVIAVLQGDTLGGGFLLAALCDFMVCAEAATYGYTDAARRFYPTAADAVLFAERFGDVLAGDLLFISTPSTGHQLRAKGWTCPILPAAQAETYARKLAETLATKSQDALRLLKQHLTRRLAGPVNRLTRVDDAIEDTAEAVATPIAPAAHLRLHTSVERVLAITLGQGSVTDLLEDLGGVFAQLEQDGYYKAVVISSEAPEFLSDDVPLNLVSEFQRVIAEAAIPVVAALHRNARGNAWLIAQLCDACVYNQEGIYSFAGAGQAAAAIFAHRFGNDAGKEILLTGAEYSGADLQRRIGAVVVAEQDHVFSAAVNVAASWATLPHAALRSWKNHTASALREKIGGLTNGSEEQDEASEASVTAAAPVALHSSVVTATAHPGGVLVVKAADREAKNMFSDAFLGGLTEVLAHIEQTPYKVVILTGYDQYFASGGTKENLLAVQAGRAKFTDTKVFQMALDCKVPVIAAMQGHGIGAGWCLGMFADLVLLSEESRYVSPYMDYGFTPGAGATWVLADKMGQDLARESLLAAQAYTGRDLKERGLTLRIMPRSEVGAAAMALARQIAQQPRRQLVDLKQRLTAYVREPLEETYRLELAMHDKTFVGRAETLAQIENTFHQEVETAPAAPPQPRIEPARRDWEGDALPAVIATLKTLLANDLLMRESDIDEDAQFMDLGLDSIAGVSWVRKINETYQTSIEPTKVYSYATLAQFSRYVKEEAEKVGAFSRTDAPQVEDTPVTPPPQKVTRAAVAPAASAKQLTSRRSRAASRFSSVAPAPALPQPIAIVGMAGQFPQAKNIDEFWRNLAEGRNCITQVPRERWDADTYYQPGEPVAGKTYCQSVGALDEYDLFDPLFFNISPTEAEHMDPQQRLFLQACWHSIENAGYDARSLSGSKCGVFVGCTTSDYHAPSPAHALSAHGFTGSATSILAARISYLLNLQGPCVSIDTACSSSLVAIAQACDSLTTGVSDLALAAGVYVMGGPVMHIRASQTGMLSPQGQCFSFDQRANGFVPGEGVGVVVLKRLADAERDRDVIYGVVQGWGVNQDGRTNGITSPNPESQTRLEQEVYDKYGIDPANIQLIEAHGTATKLGDPIEVEGLKQAFKKYTQRKEYCALGSVKSNIGHCLTAAGVAGVIKILLALKHKQLPPTINFERLNEHIDLTNSPFYVNTRLQEWELKDAPRRQAAISSFGFSGTNAHLVIGEHLQPAGVERPALISPRGAKTIVPLSARTAEQLREKALGLLEFIRTAAAPPDLSELAYTLQVGRAPMEERLGFLVTTVEQLTQKLQAYVDGEQRIEDAYQGHVKRNKEALSLLTSDSDLRKTIDQWIADKKLSKLLDLWAKGLDFDWNALYGEVKPQRISLPVYPFAKERYRIEQKAAPALASATTAILHPLLHSNVSDLSEQRYRSTFAGTEFFLADHHVLPAAAYLEMVRAAVEHASPAHSKTTVLELHDTLWGAPFIANGDHPVNVALTNEGEGIAYEVYSHGADQDVVHCQGRATVTGEPRATSVDIEQLRVRLAQRQDGELLAHLRLPENVAATTAEYVLHPSLVQGAFEAALLLCGGGPALALQTLRVIAPCTPEMFAWARYSPADGSVDIDLCDAGGNVCVQLHGLSPRPSTRHAVASTERHEEIGTVLAAPVWKVSNFERSRGAVEFAEHHVVLCDLPEIDATRLGAFTLSLETGHTDLARRYTEYTLASFERIQAILQSKPQGRVLFQIVIRDREEDAPLTGLFALVKTAGQEHPYFLGQVIVVPQDVTTEDVAVYLEDEKSGGLHSLIRYERGVRHVLRWSELPAAPAPAPIAFKEHGVYLVTGGTGGLGVVFAKEILAQLQATVVLTGRSPLTKETQDLLDELSGRGRRVGYRQIDLTDVQQVIDAIEGIRDEYGPLDGILHCAGMAADNFIVRKTTAELAQVLAPKVTGTCNLDEATKDVELDFFVLFSSVASVLGNAGQADYAAANAFMDQFAARRNRQVDAKQRHGRTRSINWPLWQAGRMSIDAAAQKRLKEAAGLLPMQTATGLQAFHRSLASPSDQLLVLEGIPAKIRAHLAKVRAFEAPESHVEPQREAAPSIEQLQRDVKAILAAVLRVDDATIDLDQPFVEFGLDSFLGAELMASINKKLGTELAHIVVFDHPTVRQLSGFLEKQLGTLPRPRMQPPPTPAVIASGAYPLLKKRARTGRTAARQDTPRDERVAIIGMAGRYPQANNLGEYWSHLAAGRNCVTEVPASRWDVKRHYDPSRTRKDTTYSKWLGAVDDVDCFDPLFFRISPNEAEHIDPQHRLFLQESYRAFEDAGYSPDALANKKGGVYLGISTNEYASLLMRNRVLSVPVTSNSSAIAAARIAYYLNLKGPAIAVDTACSSALVAIHLACQALSRGEVDFALAGGVTLWLAPESYVAMSQAGMFSPNGQCKTFDDSADGIVNGEGVGAVVLKRLQDAERDHDFIYGVILGSGVNQDGKTNGITAPSVASQIELERGIYAKYRIDPETITYVEAHGTGTKLGDPIELEALSTVFREKTDRKHFCALGSVKSNIGHTTSAAGVAGVHKVLLSMQHRTLVPTLNVTKETTRFDFANSPFYLSKTTQPWNVAPGSLRRAAVSSFGFSGTNAHLVLEEYEAPAAPAAPQGESFIVPLSARTPEQLRQRSRDLLELLRTSERPVDLAAVAYTLQVGREAMEERLGFVASSVEQLAERLRAFVDGEKNIDGFCRGRIEQGGEGMAVVGRDEDMQEAIGKWIARRKLAKLLDLWVRGVSFDWNELYGGVLPRRISLPGYPFRKDRCWIDVAPAAEMLHIRPAADETMKSIDDIIDQIGADMIGTEQAIAALKMLV